jgi:hypothetical protein
LLASTGASLAIVTVGANSAKVLQFNDFRQSPSAGTADGNSQDGADQKDLSQILTQQIF